MTKFAVCLGASSREPIRRVQDLARMAEACGLDCMWLLDSQLVMKDVYVAMTLGVLATERLKFGTGVTTPFNRHPTVTANAISAVSEVSGGRVVLGIGAGDSAVKPLGIHPASVAQMERTVSGLRTLLGGGAAAFSDEQPAPVRVAAARPEVPVYMAAGQPRMLRVAGRHADGAIVMGPNRPEWIRQQIATVVAGAEEAGRSRKDLFIDVWLTVSIDDDRQRAIEDVKPWVAAQARRLAALPRLPEWAMSYRSELEEATRAYDFAHHLSRHATHRQTVSDGLAAAVAIPGTLEECRDRIRAIAAEDVDRITMTLLAGDREARLRTIGGRLLPALA